jgi:DNA-binding MarR family transcriptional regulator
MTHTRTDAFSSKRTLYEAFRFIETFRELRPDMPMQTASILLLIAMKPGIGQRELLDLMDISQAGVSRNVYALLDTDRHGKPGLNFVSQRRHPSDGRNTELHLTSEGHAFLHRLLAGTHAEEETISA